MTLVVCFLSFHYVLVYLLNFHYVLVYLLNYEFVDVWFLSQLYLKLGPGFNSILVPPLLSTAVAGGGAGGGKDRGDVVAIHGVRVSREPAMVVAKDGSRNYTPMSMAVAAAPTNSSECERRAERKSW